VRLGFALRRLELAGPGKKPAVVEFVDGLNVICGPSDTGKTFILQCIDFCLGAGDTPEAIPHAAGYTSASLTIAGRADSVHRTLTRALAGGGITLDISGDKPRVLAAKHKGDDTSTVSGYLLDLCGLTGHHVRTHAHGSTRSLSFRDVARLTIVDESAVMDKSAPARTAHGRDKTVEDRVFRFVLTGEDDHAVVADEDPKAAKVRRSGRTEIIEQLIGELEQERGGASVPDDDIAAGERRLSELDARRREAADALETEQATVAGAEARRRPIWERLRETESRLDVLRELQTRFVLLQDQYRTDLRRLEATAEAGGRLAELGEERCPVCGALAEHHDRDHAPGLPTPGEVVAASRAEAVKIAGLMGDLTSTISMNAADIDALEATRAGSAEELVAVDTQIDAQFRPRLVHLTRVVREAEREHQHHLRGLELRRREFHLRELLGDARKPVAKPTFHGALAGPTSAEAEEFARYVEAQLRAWRFPDLTRVTFSDHDQDVVVSGQARRSRGKGVRALTHAAFTLGLLRLALDKARPFPGLALIDSPLVVYQEPDPGEDQFPIAVRDEFFRATAADFLDAQIVILENGAPPIDVAATASVTHFTKSDHGRYGFIPAG
jgi:hypothetical protein